MSGGITVKRVIVLDRDLLTSQAVARALDSEEDFHVLGTAVSVEEVQDLVQEKDVDMVLASRYLDSEDVFGLARWFRERNGEDIPHLVVTGLTNQPGVILRYLEAGASGYTLGKVSMEEMVETLRRLDAREVEIPPRLGHLLVRRVGELAEALRDRGLSLGAVEKLTRRERDVLGLLAEGLTNREIAKRLYVSVGTVKSHVHKILGKLNVRSREAAARVAQLREAGE